MIACNRLGPDFVGYLIDSNFFFNNARKSSHNGYLTQSLPYSFFLTFFSFFFFFVCSSSLHLLSIPFWTVPLCVVYFGHIWNANSPFFSLLLPRCLPQGRPSSGESSPYNVEQWSLCYWLVRILRVIWHCRFPDQRSLNFLPRKTTWPSLLSFFFFFFLRWAFPSWKYPHGLQGWAGCCLFCWCLLLLWLDAPQESLPALSSRLCLSGKQVPSIRQTVPFFLISFISDFLKKTLKHHSVVQDKSGKAAVDFKDPEALRFSLTCHHFSVST